MGTMIGKMHLSHTILDMFGNTKMIYEDIN